LPIPYKWVSGTLVSGSDYNNARLYREASYIVFKENNIYYAYAQNSGSTDFSGSTCITVVTNALSAITGSGGGTLYFKRGTYTLTDQLLLLSGSLSVIGENRDSTVLQLTSANNTNNVIYVLGATNATKKGIRIADLTLDCNSNGGCIGAYNVSESLFHNLRMKNAKNALTMNLGFLGAGTVADPYQYNYCRNNIISNCIFEDATTSGSTIFDLCGGGNVDTIYVNNTCRNNVEIGSGSAYTVRACKNNIFIGNTAYNVQNGFAMDGGYYTLIGNKVNATIYGFVDWGYTPDSGTSKYLAHDCRLIGNEFISSGSGIYFAENSAADIWNLGVPYQVIIQGNRIIASGASNYGIYTQSGSQDFTITDNYIQHLSGDACILLNMAGWGDALRANVSGNTCITPLSYAIYIQQPKSCIINGNIIKGQHGININQSANGVQVNDNNVQVTSNYGIRFSGSDAFQCSNNMISGSTTMAIVYLDVANGFIHGNFIMTGSTNGSAASGSDGTVTNVVHADNFVMK